MQNTTHQTTGAAQHENVQGGTGYNYPAGVRGDSNAPGYSNVTGIHPGDQKSEQYQLPVGENGHHGDNSNKPSTMDKIKAKLPGSHTTTTTSTTHSGAHDQAGMDAHHQAHNSALGTHGSAPGAYPNTQQPSAMDKVINKVTPGDDLNQQQHGAAGTYGSQATHGSHGQQGAYGNQPGHNAGQHAGQPSTMEKIADKVTPGTQYPQSGANQSTYADQRATHGSHGTQGAYGNQTGHHAGQPSTMEKIADKVTPGMQYPQSGANQGAYNTNPQATHGTHGTQGAYGTQAGHNAGQPTTMEKVADKVTPGTHYPQSGATQGAYSNPQATHGSHAGTQQPGMAYNASHTSNQHNNNMSTTDKLMDKITPNSSTQHGTQQQDGAYDTTRNTQQQQHPYAGGAGTLGNTATSQPGSAYNAVHPSNQHSSAGANDNLTTKDKIMDKLTGSTQHGTQQHGAYDATHNTQQQQHPYAAGAGTMGNTPGHNTTGVQHGSSGVPTTAQHGTTAHDNTSSSNSGGGLLSSIKDKLSSSNK